jgi:hypothetical protein
MNLGHNATAREIYNCASITVIHNRLDDAMKNPCTEKEMAFFEEVRACENDLDRIHLCCAKALGFLRTVKRLEAWIVEKDARAKKKPRQIC